MSADPQRRDSTPPGVRPPSGPTAQQPEKRPRFRISWWWIVLVIALFAINYYAGSRATQQPSRVRVPYTPYFLQQVTDGHVKEITSKGTAIQGTFTQKESYKGSKPTTRFKTEIPTFADTDALSKLLQEKKVVVNAQPLQTGTPWWENLLLGFGPTLLFLLLLVFLLRRAGNVQGMLGAFGRSRARRYQPSGDRVTFADVAGIDEAKEELAEV
ncbi:MAG TPA: ATP-dependent metallopeptidase FtsH/Yme1/Tma family protein, partial [Gaiellaceae bacterium]|nr:ATP-dependent metallopeptidase FtsH/Yme1/Tma family protein [Gaiellaceae bacterium]